MKTSYTQMLIDCIRHIELALPHQVGNTMTYAVVYPFCSPSDHAYMLMLVHAYRLRYRSSYSELTHSYTLQLYYAETDK